MSEFKRQMIAISETKNSIICIDTFELSIRYIQKDTLKNILVANIQKSNNIIFRNITIGFNIHIREEINNKLVIIVRLGNKKYLCMDSHKSIKELQYEFIKKHKEMFIDIKFVGSGITSKSSEIPLVSEIEKKSIKILNFNEKARLIGLPQLSMNIIPVSQQVICNFIDPDLAVTTKINKLIIPDFVEKIQVNAFYNRRIEEVYIGNSVRKIPEHCFLGVKELKYVKFGNNTTEIEDGSFGETRELQQLDNMNNIKIIGACAFYRSGIRIFKAGEELQIIKGSAFEKSKLEKVYLGESHVNKIGDKAFAQTNLRFLELSRYIKEFSTSCIPSDIKSNEIVIHSKFNIRLDKYSDSMKQLKAELYERMSNM